MPPQKPPHILNAASNLLGICFILITGIKLTARDVNTLADEITVFAAFCFLSSCILSYSAMRSERNSSRFEDFADHAFMLGLIILFIAVFIFAGGIL
ncbi:MAG: hypothetical protein EYC62_00755 [Alphaproteobacteria bacterium]|nr:MAG: hypothetical protein EYC62_00755 [Alphaproteobacteria bacterium]